MADALEHLKCAIDFERELNWTWLKAMDFAPQSPLVCWCLGRHRRCSMPEETQPWHIDAVPPIEDGRVQ